MLTASDQWLGGGPPQAVCVADCSTDASVCEQFENAICVESTKSGSNGNPRALCLKNCVVGTASVTAPSCSDAPRQTCELLDPETKLGFCRPLCVADIDCGTRYCDRSIGACVATVSTNSGSFGNSCSDSSSTCAGVCVKLASEYTICSHRCVFGSMSDCFTGNDDTPSAICAYGGPMSGPGDLGFCAPLCNCDDQCAASGIICESFEDAALVKRLGRSGVCVPSVDSEGVVIKGTPCR